MQTIAYSNTAINHLDSIATIFNEWQQHYDVLQELLNQDLEDEANQQGDKVFYLGHALARTKATTFAELKLKAQYLNRPENDDISPNSDTSAVLKSLINDLLTFGA